MIDPKLFSQLRDIARSVTDLHKRVTRIERASQQQFRSSTGSQMIYDNDGNIRQIIGLQPDGSFTFSDVNAPPPPAPSTPGMIPQPGLMTITWDGQTADGADWPRDFHHVDVHIYPVSGTTPTAGNQYASFHSTTGGAVTIAVGAGLHYVVLTAVNTAGTRGAASAETSSSTVSAITVGGITTFYVPSVPAPVANSVGDLWYVTDQGNILKYWDGDTWADIVQEVDASLLKNNTTLVNNIRLNGSIVAYGPNGEQVGISGADGFFVNAAPSGGGEGSRWIHFPVDGQLPNIISGQLNASTVNVDSGMTINGLSSIEPGGQMLLAGMASAPKNSPTLTSTYDTLPIDTTYAYSGLTKGHTGNWFTIGTASGSSPVIVEISATTGAIVNTTAVPDTVYPQGGIIYNATYSCYYIIKAVGRGLGSTAIPAIETLTTSFTLTSTTTVTYFNSGAFPDTPTLGFDHANNVPLLGDYYMLSVPPDSFYYPLTVNGTGGVTGLGTAQHLTGNAAVDQIRYLAKGLFDYSSSRVIVAYDNVATFKTFLGNTHNPSESWPQAGVAMTGGWYDGSNFYSIGAGVISKYEKNDSTGGAVNDSWWIASNGGNRWVGYTWYEDTVSTATITNKALTANVATLTTSANHGFTSNGYVTITGVDSTFNGTYVITSVPTSTTFTYAKTHSNVTSIAATGSATGVIHETMLSPRAFLSLNKRAKIGVTIQNIPVGSGGPDSPTKARVWVANQSSDPGGTGSAWKQRNVIVTPNTFGPVDSRQVIDTTQSLPSATLFPPVNNPGGVVSADGGSYWYGDNTAQFYQLILTSGRVNDVNTSAGNKPALRIGDINGFHMRVDNNEFQSMSSPTTTARISLNSGGGQVNMSGADSVLMGGQIITGWNWDWARSVSLTSGAGTIAHGLSRTPTGVIVSNANNAGDLAWTVTSVDATNINVRCVVVSTGASVGTASRNVAFIAIC